MTERPTIALPPLVGRQLASWRALLELAPRLGNHWTLVGGQMVFLHEVERQATETRPTDDVDMVADLLAEPNGLARIHRVLSDSAFEQLTPNADEIAHRYQRGEATIDVLAPNGLGARARLRLGAGHTIAAPASRQALARTFEVAVSLADGSASATIRRPSLVGALLGKIAATGIVAQSRSERAKHLRDTDALAVLIGPDDRASERLTTRERSTLRTAAGDLELRPLAKRSLEILAEH